MKCRLISRRRSILALRSLPVRPRGTSIACYKTHSTNRLQPIYNFLAELPALDGAAAPYLPPERLQRYSPPIGSFDAGRGCPFQCSFCTIINVQGRKSRFRTADDIEHLLRAHLEKGVTRFFITDDDFARNRHWEQILDRIIALREREKYTLHLSDPGGRTRVPNPKFHREVPSCWVPPRIHRPGDDKFRQSAARQETPEQDRRSIGQCCRHGEQPASSPFAAISSASPRILPPLSSETLIFSSASCLSIVWSSSCSRRCPDRRTIRNWLARASRWNPT